MATNSKMFVHYSGTKSAFIAAGLPSQYTNKIVFIKGGENGTGACVYTHGNYYANVEEALAALKYFSKISAGGQTATAAGPEGTINFSADDPASVSVKVDSYGVHFALTDEFKKAVNEVLPGRIKAIEDDYLKADDKTALQGEISSAVNGAKEEIKGTTDGLANRIKAVEDDYLKAEDKTALQGEISSAVNGAKEEIKGTTDGLAGRIKAIEDDYLNAEDKTELEGKVNSTLAEAKGYTDSEVSRIVADSGSGLIGQEGDASSANTIYGAKTYAEEKAAAAQTAAEEAAAADATSKVNAAKEEIKGTTDGLANRIKAVEDDYLKAEDKTALQGEISGLDGRVEAVEGAITVLNGDGDGSVNKKVADAIAGVVASAPEDFDTLKEVADWIANDTTGAAKMQADIAKLNGADTVEGSVAKQVKDAVAAEAAIARAAEKLNADDIDAAEGRILAIEQDYLKTADKTELNGLISAAQAKADAAAPQATTYTKDEVDGLISGAEGKLADYYKKSETYTKAEVDAMWEWEEL